MSNYKQISNTAWNVAELLRGPFKPRQYQDVVLPLVVLKRLDSVLEPTKNEVLERYDELGGSKATKLDILESVTGFGFYNTSRFTLETLLTDSQKQLGQNLRNYIAGFSQNILDVFDKFEFDEVINKLEGGDLLFLVLTEINSLELHPDVVTNRDIGLAFEDLIRRFNELSTEDAGDHYTPRDVVRLMTALAFSGEEDELKKPGTSRSIYDPACGTGGMLTESKNYILEQLNPNAHIYLFGQELNPQTYAVCKADIIMKGDDPHKIKGGEKDSSLASTLSNDQHANEKFDYIISNPPYGVDWKKDEKVVKKEAERGYSGRFGAGLPRISDGQLLFLQHMISKFNNPSNGKSDAAIIMNGSPLFTGDAGQGESEIRRWVLENDYLDTIVALPGQLFFNTGIPTYIWILSNKKEEERKGKVMLIDGREMKSQLRKNLGDKRYEIDKTSRTEIVRLYNDYKETEHSKIFKTEEFGYRKITIHRPERYASQFTAERVKTLRWPTTSEGAVMKSLFEEHGEDIFDKSPDFWKEVRADLELKNKAKLKDEKLSVNAIKKITSPNYWSSFNSMYHTGLRLLEHFGDKKWMNFLTFVDEVKQYIKEEKVEIFIKDKLQSPSTAVIKKLCLAMSERDEEAEPVIKNEKDGVITYMSDSEVKDYERVPFGTDIYEYFEKEVLPYVTDAWIDEEIKDAEDGKVGIIGCEIPFTRYFYEYKPPRALKDIGEDIEKVENELLELLNDL